MMSFTKNIQREIILLSKINYTLKDKNCISLMYVYLIYVFIGYIYIQRHYLKERYQQKDGGR